MIYTKADGLLNKRSDFMKTLKFRPSVIAITEVLPKASKNVNIEEFSIPGYNVFLNDYKKGRGVMLYIESCYDTSLVEVSEDFDEFLAVVINKKHTYRCHIARAIGRIRFDRAIL